jgi:hypothetical protein
MDVVCTQMINHSKAVLADNFRTTYAQAARCRIHFASQYVSGRVQTPIEEATMIRYRLTFFAALIAASSALRADTTPSLAPDIPAKFTVPTQAFDYEKHEVMIPMRDGVKLHTVIMIPKGATRAPIILTRTPYNADKRAERNVSPYLLPPCLKATSSFRRMATFACFRTCGGNINPKAST